MDERKRPGGKGPARVRQSRSMGEPSQSAGIPRPSTRDRASGRSSGDLLVGAEPFDRATPQPVLHAGLDHQRQVAVRQRLEAADHHRRIGRLVAQDLLGGEGVAGGLTGGVVRAVQGDFEGFAEARVRGVGRLRAGGGVGHNYSLSAMTGVQAVTK